MLAQSLSVEVRWQSAVACKNACRTKWSLMTGHTEVGEKVRFLISTLSSIGFARMEQHNLSPVQSVTMRFIPGFVSTCCLLSVMPSLLLGSPEKASSDEQVVLAPIQTMFDGMTKRDAQLIRNPVLPGGSMVLMRDGKPIQLTFEAFAARVAKPGTSHIEERIHDPLVRIDHDLALVWAPFEVLVDDKLDHCGTDLFTLIRTDGKWLIASVADTSTQHCSVK